jgi:hypothetical protein
MRHTSRWVFPLLALVLIAPVAVAEKKKKDSDKVQTKDKIKSSGQFLGRLTVVENSSRHFTVQVEYVEQDPNKVLANAQHDRKRRFEISLVTDPRERQKQLLAHLVDMQQRLNDSYRRATKDIELEGDEDMKVRTMILPPNYDEKGKIKKRTRKELAELKGPNKSLPGYSAEWDNLNKDQIVRVYLAKQKKGTPKPRVKSKTKDAEEDKELFTERPKAVMVVIMAEPMKRD